jgi:hypothetical protein
VYCSCQGKYNARSFGREEEKSFSGINLGLTQKGNGFATQLLHHNGKMKVLFTVSSLLSALADNYFAEILPFFAIAIGGQSLIKRKHTVFPSP